MFIKWRASSARVRAAENPPRAEVFTFFLFFVMSAAQHEAPCAAREARDELGGGNGSTRVPG
ncbi:MAG: hypothetical protein WAL51_10440, partial [Candidatus Acidiferrales bacterium]